MGIFKKYKISILIITIAIVAGAAYTILFSEKESALLVAERPEDSVSTQESDLLTLLLDLRSVKLDESVFSDPVFKSLVDFGQELVSEPVGRENPFAPINLDRNAGE
ncbi:MAG: hypothetical protein QGG63_00980 [Candidatus Pacebacteria bacterium]|jgi:hypothetical protein|nr:hypothetical protein [Candidatus Paceibacterota bacterium]|tara:strand:+ start:30297 stop:30617 length:321 start_codon:yes stop_codon:yes gene_type:complete